MNRKRNQITIRPQQPFAWLGLAALLFGGALMASSVYGRGVWLFAAVFVATLIGCVGDALVFDGEQLTRRGLKSLCGSLCFGRANTLALADIETISTLVTNSRRNGALVYRTTITGAGQRWIITSRRSSYPHFIQALFSAVSPNALDPRSRDLLNYWPESEQLNLWQSATLSPALMTPPRMWRKLANHFALAGQFDAAARYFRLAYRQDSRNAQLLYEIGRFLRLRVMLEQVSPEEKNQRVKGRRRRIEMSPVRQSEACLRLAGRLASGDAALLERIGETFFEMHQDHLALRYFERALQVDAQRLRATIGLAEVALRSGQAARVVYYYRAAARVAETRGDLSLAGLAERQAAYYERLREDDRFLDAEMWRLDLLDQLKWARRGALVAFLASWLVHLTCVQFAPAVQALSREISATSAIIWLTTITASYFFSQRRN